MMPTLAVWACASWSFGEWARFAFLALLIFAFMWTLWATSAQRDRESRPPRRAPGRTPPPLPPDDEEDTT